MILFLHNRYRVTGGEERAVEDLLWLVREHLGEEAELLERDSAALGRSRAAVALLRGGLRPTTSPPRCAAPGARVVSAHNLNPAFGWRALAAARAAGARVVLHLHNYRLVCAVGTCFNSRGEDCVRCQGRDTLPGVRLNCRGTGAEAAVYGASLALWQRRLAAQADAVVVPSRFAARAPARAARAARSGARARRAPRRARVRRRLAGGGRRARARGLAAGAGEGRRARGAGLRAARASPLVVAGDGPQAAALRAAGGARFVGRVSARRAGRPARPRRAGDRALALGRDLRPGGGRGDGRRRAGGRQRRRRAAGARRPDGLVAPGDVDALAVAARARFGDEDAGAAGLQRVRELAAPEVVAAALRPLYG